MFILYSMKRKLNNLNLHILLMFLMFIYIFKMHVPKTKFFDEVKLWILTFVAKRVVILELLYCYKLKNNVFKT